MGIEQGDMWQDYLFKSERNLAVAERDLESGSYDPCVSRAYFAAFQAAIAALLALTDFQRRGRYWVVRENNNGYLTQLSAEGRPLFRSRLASL